MDGDPFKDKESEIDALVTDGMGEDDEEAEKDEYEGDDEEGDLSEDGVAAVLQDSQEHDEDGSAKGAEDGKSAVLRQPLATGPSALKILVSRRIAGSLIGQAGAHIIEVQTRSGARVHLSGQDCCFPGTGNRVALLSGEPEQCKAAATLLCAKLHQTMMERPNVTGTRMTLRILVPRTASGLLIGRAGANIKEMSEISGSTILLLNKEPSPVPSELTMTISGELEAVTAGVNLVIDRLVTGPNSGRYQFMSVNYRQTVPASAPKRGRGARGQQARYTAVGLPNNADENPRRASGGNGSRLAMNDFVSGVASAPANTTIQVRLPNSVIGAIVGVRGSSITELQRLSGAKIVISPREEAAAAGNEERLITITGSPMEAQTAQFLISKKIELEGQNTAAPPRPSRKNRAT